LLGALAALPFLPASELQAATKWRANHDEKQLRQYIISTSYPIGFNEHIGTEISESSSRDVRSLFSKPPSAEGPTASSRDPQSGSPSRRLPLKPKIRSGFFSFRAPFFLRFAL
jgi:hypothetical protein